MLIHTVKDLIDELNKLDKDMPIRSIRNKQYSHVDVVINIMYDPEDEFINVVLVHWIFFNFKKRSCWQNNIRVYCVYIELLKE